MSIFDHTKELPDQQVKQQSSSLIGFDKKFKRIYTNLKLLLDQEGLATWSELHHDCLLPAVTHLTDKYPLIILAGDAGTGKTVTAQAIADTMTRELKKEAHFLKLSTRVRGEGLHGEMGNLVNNAFQELRNLAGKKKLAFLLIDEADAIATTRSTGQMHQEEKAAVNTLIQKIDEIRELGGRAVVFMSTNRLHFLDEAIVRRAAIVLEFERPDSEERQKLFAQDLEGLNLTEDQLAELAALTGPDANDGLGHSFSDLRLKIQPEAIARCYPERPLTFAVLKEVINDVKPSPRIK
ncbi:AAA family ATPase [Rubrolithibacter danxiaensis]|uniref:AAA family ATPase n=1 Tax=Rubrolithibacter danxiaensis TaxID=3390805 RepID=UPI003BF82D45